MVRQADLGEDDDPNDDVIADYVYSRADRQICQPVIDNLRAREDRRDRT